MPELRIAILGLTHDHVWGNVRELLETPGAELVGAADPHEELRRRFETEFGRPTEPAYHTLLDRTRPDAVFLFSDNAACVELAEMAAARGLHILVEKPMAHSLDGADRMLQAARRAGVRLMVNWPFAWWPALQHALRMASAGDIGPLWQVKYRAAHAGPDRLGCSSYFCQWLFDAELNGGGAFIDYCCYGAALARVLLGLPSRVYGSAARLRREDILVDDNGLLVMHYPQAVALAEGSWLQEGSLTAYTTVMYGTQGTLLVEPRATGRLLHATQQQPHGVPLEVPPPPPHLQSASAHFVHAVGTGEPLLPLCDPRVGRDTQEILEAGLISAQRGREVSLPLSILGG